MKPVDILLVTYNRRHLLQQTIEGIWNRTKTPYRIIVVDNNSQKDNTVEYLKSIEDKLGKVIFCDKNHGLAPGYNIGLEYVESELFFTANDDLVVPDLKPDWIQQMIKLFEKYYPEYGALSMRCARLKNVYFNNGTTITWLPYDKIGEARSSAPALFRIHKKSDILKHIQRFGTQGGYNDEYQFKKHMNQLGMRSGFLRDIWCNHTGYAKENRGYPDDFIDYAGYSTARNEKSIRLGYPEIDSKTNIPLLKEKY